MFVETVLALFTQWKTYQEKQVKGVPKKNFKIEFVNQPASADSEPVQDSGAPLPCPFEEEVRTQSVTRLSEDKQGVPQILDLIFREFRFAPFALLRVGHIASSLPPRTDRGEAPLSLGQAVSLQRLVGWQILS